MKLPLFFCLLVVATILYAVASSPTVVSHRGFEIAPRASTKVSNR